MATQAEDVIRAHGYPAKVWLGDLEAGVDAAMDAIQGGAKVIVSRGGTAQMILAAVNRRQPVPVIEVETSVYDAVSYVHANVRPGFRVAVVGFSPFTVMGGSVCESMDVEHRVFAINNASAATGIIKTLIDWQPDAVMGDTVSCRLMADFGWKNYHLVESSHHSIRDAFERAMLFVNSLERQLAHNRKLAAVLSVSHHGVAILDRNGRVEDINRRCADMLGVNGAEFVGKSATDLFPDPGLAAALGGKKESRGNLVELNGQQLIVDCVPLASEHLSDAGGMVVTVQPSKRIQEMENAIRTRLHAKGFRARHHLRDIVHASPVVADTIAMAAEYAKSNANIVITGETGTGKELFAQGIHNASRRANGMFVAINCAALPSGLLESELFGYSPGAFTGALRSGKAGLFEIAHEGTLFLDEINEMDPFLQTRLLRAIQEGEIMRVGDSRVIPVNVRIIAAANKDLDQEVERGHLREDLFFRLNVLSLSLPPLRERHGDIALLFRHHLAQRSAKMGIKARMPDASFFRDLDQYSWPGNVRELENLAERYLVLQDRPESRALGRLLPRRSRNSAIDEQPRASGAMIAVSPENDTSAEETLDDIIRRTVASTLAAENGNIARTSRRLGINRNTLKRWMKKTDQSPW